MKQILIAGMLLLNFTSCSKKKEIAEIPLGNFDYRNQQISYKGQEKLKSGVFEGDLAQ